VHAACTSENISPVTRICQGEGEEAWYQFLWSGVPPGVGNGECLWPLEQCTLDFVSLAGNSSPSRPSRVLLSTGEVIGWNAEGGKEGDAGNLSSDAAASWMSWGTREAGGSSCCASFGSTAVRSCLWPFSPTALSSPAGGGTSTHTVLSPAQ